MWLQKVISRKNCVQKLVFCWHLEGNDENSRIRIQDPDPDPLVRGMDPRVRIRIHTKMSWIRNTASQNKIPSKIKELLRWSLSPSLVVVQRWRDWRQACGAHGQGEALRGPLRHHQVHQEQQEDQGLQQDAHQVIRRYCSNDPWY